MNYRDLIELAKKLDDKDVLEYLKRNKFSDWVKVKIEMKDFSPDEELRIKMDIREKKYRRDGWKLPKGKIKIVQMYGWVKKCDDSLEWKRYESDLS